MKYAFLLSIFTVTLAFDPAIKPDIRSRDISSFRPRRWEPTPVHLTRRADRASSSAGGRRSRSQSPGRPNPQAGSPALSRSQSLSGSESSRTSSSAASIPPNVPAPPQAAQHHGGLQNAHAPPAHVPAPPQAAQQNAPQQNAHAPPANAPGPLNIGQQQQAGPNAHAAHAAQQNLGAFGTMGRMISNTRRNPVAQKCVVGAMGCVITGAGLLGAGVVGESQGLQGAGLALTGSGFGFAAAAFAGANSLAASRQVHPANNV